MTAWYRPEPADQIVIRPLDDITLIYHRRSGQTHMVASPVPEILAALSATPSDGAGAEAILSALTADYDLGEPDAARAAIVRHLEELAALGLVHRS